MGRAGRVPRPAGRVDPELAADDVGGGLGHRPERGRLAAGNRDEPLDAVLSMWSKHLNVRLSSRPVDAPRDPMSGRAADQVARDSARIGPRGSSSRPRRNMLSHVVLGHAQVVRVVARPTSSCPTTDSSRCGTTMSPSPGLVEAVDDHVARAGRGRRAGRRARAGSARPRRPWRRSSRPRARRRSRRGRRRSRSLAPCGGRGPRTPVTHAVAGRSSRRLRSTAGWSAPLRWAVAKNRSGMRIASMVASGTWIAPLQRGVEVRLEAQRLLAA